MIVRTLLQLNSAANETMLDFEFITDQSVDNIAAAMEDLVTDIGSK
jgi:hypothetical protein